MQSKLRAIFTWKTIRTSCEFKEQRSYRVFLRRVFYRVLCFRVPILIILHFVIPSCRDNNVRASFSIHPNFFNKSWSAKRRVPFKMNKTFSRFTFPLNRCVSTYTYIYIQPTRENESSIRAEVIRS